MAAAWPSTVCLAGPGALARPSGRVLTEGPGRSNGGRGTFVRPARRALAVALCLGLRGAAFAAEDRELPPPIPWQQPAGLQRLFLQLPFEAPSVAPPGSFDCELRLIYSNTIMVAQGSAASVDIDVETAQLTALLRYGVTSGVELQLGLPFYVDYGGFLDGPIEWVEGLFHAANPERGTRPRGESRYRVSYRSAAVALDSPEAGLGDAWVGVKGVLLEDAGGWPSLALRAALKFPTGRFPFGSGEFDAGGSLLLGWAFAPVALRLQLDVAVPTAGLQVIGIPTRAYGAVQLGVAIRLGSSVALHAQASADTSPLRGTGLDEVDGGVRYVLVGASVGVSRSVELDFAAVENVFSPYRGADFAVVVDARLRL